MIKDNTSVQDITWENVQKHLQNDSYREFLRQIPLSVFKMALEKEKKSEVINIILKVLQERDHQNATIAYAQKMIEVMQDLARKILKERDL